MCTMWGDRKFGSEATLEEATNQQCSTSLVGLEKARKRYDVLMQKCGFRVLPRKVEELKGCVISAPHGGYDFNTDFLVEAIHEKVGIAAVVAFGFRNLERRHWLNVNRPTEQRFEEGQLKRKEHVTPVASWVYEDYQRHLFEAAEQSPLNFLMELHVGDDNLTAVEVVTPHFEEIQVRQLQKVILLECREYFNSNSPSFQFYELLKKETLQSGENEYEFRYPARRTQERGSLQKRNTLYGMHIEFPPSLVSDRDRLSSFLIRVMQSEQFRDFLKINVIRKRQ
ncbi:MAG: hypothetical protein GYA55_05990 [SAR324 cluster bacterium]|uniref:Uncharacterized protein n=1 Tax=SAR324 cluster bacterium TaxID=2024889 RepID=A0A7X9FR14_9DELT|nr:hypothetical protein [SAR324 cluster bacterium]